MFLLKTFTSARMLFYNGNKVSANASVPGGKSFTLSNTNYVSDAADPITEPAS